LLVRKSNDLSKSRSFGSCLRWLRSAFWIVTAISCQNSGLGAIRGPAKIAEQGEIGPDAACRLGLEGLGSKRRDRWYRAGRSTGSRSRTASTRRCRGWWMGRGDANVFNPNRQPAKGYRRSQFEAIWHSYCAEDGTTAHSSNIRTLLLADDSTA
jgi:hypothetical protein